MNERRKRRGGREEEGGGEVRGDGDEKGGGEEELVAVSRRHVHLVGRPEPAVDQLGEELRFVAAVEVALASGRPEEGDVPVNEPLHPVVLLLGLKGDQVHASLPEDGY